MPREIDRDELLAKLQDPEVRLVDAEIVVYCYNATCTGSELAAELLEGRGYRNVSRYTAGKQDWIDAGLPLEARTEHS
jgi:rhodanese-related sulfurtransferase